MSFTVRVRGCYAAIEDLTKIELVDFLLSKEDPATYDITEWDDDIIEPDGQPLILEQLSGEEWLHNNL